MLPCCVIYYFFTPEEAKQKKINNKLLVTAEAAIKISNTYKFVCVHTVTCS